MSKKEIVDALNAGLITEKEAKDLLHREQRGDSTYYRLVRCPLTDYYGLI